MLQLQVLPQDGFFLAQLSGLVSLEAWEQALRDLEAATSGAPGDRLVIDLTALVGWLGIPERTAVGACMATRLMRMKKVGLFIQPEKIVGVVQAEARRNGLDLQMFSSYQDAASWVIS